MSARWPETPRIGVVGLGYVGLPLCVAFAGQFEVLGHDRDETRIRALQAGTDRTREVSGPELEAVSNRLTFTEHANELAG
ncbi:MAG: Vi polysaccharide biosynthesis UDP-N-acetylglucosamine C-6 dehydrogenase TviB, partial [Halothiobacillaceae bacterium]